MAKRKEVVWSLQRSRPDTKESDFINSDVELTFTRRGIEVNGWYDDMVGIGPLTLIPWANVDSYRKQVSEKSHG